ncbi:hypothetical protein BHU11_10355 [Tannerella sp. oral taxon 808]|nr:hypothetical protein BHU11_10355 [Tannerella sp. oral taxon 808]
MDKDLVIKAVGQTKLDNAMHVQYHTEMYGILNSADQAKTGLPADVMTEYNAGIAQEVDINREAQADALTADLLVADRERDRAVQYLFGVVRNAQLSPDEATREAAEMLSIVVSPYKGLPAESVDRETALILGLLTDLKKPENAAHLATLGLTAMPAKIEALNKAFAELATKRSDKRATTKLPLATEIRPKTDAAYERLIFTLRSNYLFGQAPIEKAAIEALAVRLNERATELDTAYRQSAAQKRAAQKKKPKKPTDPKKPDDPKEPKEPKEPEKPADPKKPENPEKPGGGDDIHVPSEPPKKPEGVA